MVDIYEFYVELLKFILGFFMRFFFFLTMIFSLSFSKILSAQEVFSHQILPENGGFLIKFNVDSSAYLYADKLNLAINKQEINKFLNKIPSVVKENQEVYDKNFDIFLPFGLVSKFGKLDKFSLNLSYQGCSNSGFCYQVQNFAYEISQKNGKFEIREIKEQLSTQDEILSNFVNKTFFITLATFFGYGLLLSLTPCVFPMIPILSSILVAKGGKNSFLISFIYVLFASLAYAFAGILASYFGANLSSFLQIPIVIIAFSLFFVLFALAMFGAFEFQMPKFLQNLIDQKSKNKGGIIGVAIMGFFSALVMGPCVAAPLSGAILYIAKSGDMALGGAALFVMGFGMGVPLLLLGLGFGKFLPKPGIWMDKIKIIFGFLMLAMAIWMFSRLFGDDIALVLYGVLGVLFYVYFESERGKIFRFFAILILIISAFLIGNFTINQISNEPKISQKESLKFKYISNLDELNSFTRASKKPVIVDFWASWCVNCKELEDKTFTDPLVAAKMQEFELVKIDVTQNSSQNLEMMKKFEIFGPPALVFFKDGKEIESKKIVGYIDSKRFLDHISDF